MTRDGFCGVEAFDVEVGLAVRHFRTTRRISQAELAAALGVSSKQVRHYERGMERMGAARLVRAAKLLNVAPEDLLPPASSLHATPDAADFSAGEAEGVEGSAMTSPRHRRAVLDLIQALQP